VRFSMGTGISSSIRLLIKNNSIELPVFVILLCVPFSKFDLRIWDGAVISYALTTSKDEILHDWLFSSGWEIQYFLIKATESLAGFFTISFEHLTIITSLVSVYLISILTRRMAKRYFGFSDNASRIAGLVVLVFPGWNVLVSSVMNIHIICLAVGLLAQEAHFSKKRYSRLVEIPLALFSFQLNSMLVFLPALIVLLGWRRHQGRLFQSVFKKDTLLIYLLAVLYYSVKEIFNANEGDFVDYNSIVSPFELFSWKLYVADMVSYSSFLLIPLCLALPMLTYSLLEANPFESFIRNNFKTLFALIALFTAGVTPYILVGKNSSLFDIHDWNQRQAILVSVPLALLVGYVIEGSRNLFGVKSSEEILCILALALPIFLLTTSLSEKLNRQMFDTTLVEFLNQELPKPNPGIVTFNIDKEMTPIIRSYESNVLMHRAYFQSVWWSTIQFDSARFTEIPPYVSERNSKDFAYEWQNRPCNTLLTFEVSGFHPNLWDIFVTESTKSNKIKLVEKDEICN
jgi:hypothetical protein